MENVKGAVKQHKMKFVWVIVLLVAAAISAVVINTQVQAGRVETKCPTVKADTPFYNLPKGKYTDFKTGATWSLLGGIGSRSHFGSYEKSDIPDPCTSAVDDIKVPIDFIFVDSESNIHHAEYALGFCFEGCEVYDKEQVPLP